MLEITRVVFYELKNKLEGTSLDRLKSNIVSRLLKQRAEVFDREESADGPWEDIKDVDAKLSRRLKSFKRGSQSKKAKELREKNKILQDRGVLRASFTGVGNPEGRSQLVELDGPDEVGIRTNVEYAKFLNDGTKHMVARPMDQFTDDNIQEINEVLEGHIYE